jgi:hypothetical protein
VTHLSTKHKLENFTHLFAVKHGTASVFPNPEIPGFMNFQSRDPGLILWSGIPGFRDPGVATLVASFKVLTKFHCEGSWSLSEIRFTLDHKQEDDCLLG